MFPIEDSFSLVRLTPLVDLLGALGFTVISPSKCSRCHLALSHVHVTQWSAWHLGRVLRVLTC